MIQAFVWQATEEHKNLVRKLVSAAPEEVASQPLEVVELNDASNQSREITGDLLLAFGPRSVNLLQANTEKSIVHMPSVRKLVNIPGNKVHRAEAFQIIKDLKILGQGKKTTLSDKDLLKFSQEQLTNLKKTLKQKKIEYWVGHLEKGARVAIVLDPKTKVDNCDITLTFEEIFAAKYAIEILGLKGLTLITGDKDA